MDEWSGSAGAGDFGHQSSVFKMVGSRPITGFCHGSTDTPIVAAGGVGCEKRMGSRTTSISPLGQSGLRFYAGAFWTGHEAGKLNSRACWRVLPYPNQVHATSPSHTGTQMALEGGRLTPIESLTGLRFLWLGALDVASTLRAR